MNRTAIAALLVGAFTITLAAQSGVPRFEVASVKRQAAEIPPTPPSGAAPALSATFRRVNATLVTLIRFAYRVTDAEVMGGPEWARKDLFEIHAKAASATSPEGMRPMVAALLAERFRLVLRREQRLTRGALLVMARDDGRVGPKLERCADSNAPPRASAPVRILSPYILNGRCQPIASVAASASAFMGVPVVDRTGLDGLWSYYVFYIRPERPRPARDAEQAALLPFDGALEAELGLRVQESQGPFDVLVIDSVQQPTPD
jgi:uncharacterized protein (TIGR03435 family)